MRVELARISEADEHAGLPEPELLARPGSDGLQLFDERLEALTADEKIGMARDAEAAALAHDPRITNSDGGSLSTVVGEIALANSHGFASAYPVTSVSLSVEVMADDADGKKRNAYWYTGERILHRLADPASVGRIAAQRAVDQIGARKGGDEARPRHLRADDGGAARPRRHRLRHRRARSIAAPPSSPGASTRRSARRSSPSPTIRRCPGVWRHGPSTARASPPARRRSSRPAASTPSSSTATPAAALATPRPGARSAA